MAEMETLTIEVPDGAWLEDHARQTGYSTPDDLVAGQLDEAIAALETAEELEKVDYDVEIPTESADRYREVAKEHGNERPIDELLSYVFTVRYMAVHGIGP